MDKGQTLTSEFIKQQNTTAMERLSERLSEFNRTDTGNGMQVIGNERQDKDGVSSIIDFKYFGDSGGLVPQIIYNNFKHEWIGFCFPISSQSSEKCVMFLAERKVIGYYVTYLCYEVLRVVEESVEFLQEEAEFVEFYENCLNMEESYEGLNEVWGFDDGYGAFCSYMECVGSLLLIMKNEIISSNLKYRNKAKRFEVMTKELEKSKASYDLAINNFIELGIKGD